MKNLHIGVLLFLNTSLINAQNIGIGTNNPTSKLHVVGQVKADSMLIASNSTANELLAVNSFSSSVDQQQTISNGVYQVPFSGWQSFTASKSGILSNVEFYWNKDISTNLEIRIYAGEGAGVNTQLFTKNINTSIIPSGGYPYTNVAITGVVLTANEKYTIWLSSSMGWAGSYDNPYSGGLSGNSAIYDFAFKTYMKGLNALTVKNDGKVGIGKINPAFKLDVGGTTNTDHLNVTTLSTTNSLLVTGPTGLNTLTVGNGTVTSKILRGVEPIGQSMGKTVTIPITFSTPFTSIPMMFANVITQQGQNANDGFSVTIKNLTTAGCELIITRTDSDDAWLQYPKVNWMAIE